ncbi:Crp/Fnr family transcriptional regulator, partial [Enterococcus faecalis]
MRNVLKDYLDQHSFRVVVKKMKNYLTYEGLQDRYASILTSGIFKTSVISNDGRVLNLGYINKLDIVSLLREEDSEFIDGPFNIRIESP